MKKRLFLFILPFLFFSCFGKKLSVKNIEFTNSLKDKIQLKVEVADTYETRQKGFMERKRIPSGTGMIFVFEEDQILSFWMKNTPTALSIAYITSNGKILDIFDMKPYSVKSIVSTGYVRYAVEVPKGWFSDNNIKPGDFVDLSEVTN